MKRWLMCLATLLSFLPACASTDLTNKWKNPEYSGNSISKVLIVGIADHPGVRRAFEDTFVQALAKLGVQAVASYSVVPSRGRISDEELVKAVEQTEANGVLITRLVSRETEESYAPASMG